MIYLLKISLCYDTPLCGFQVAWPLFPILQPVPTIPISNFTKAISVTADKKKKQPLPLLVSFAINII